MYLHVTVQLKPHFLPRLIINSPYPIFICSGPKKPPQARKWLDQVCSMDLFCRLGADMWTLGMRIGLNKGYETTPIPKKAKPSQLKGRLSNKTQFVRSVVREVVGFAPYERRVLELLRNSKVSNSTVAYHSPDLNAVTLCRIRRPGS